MNAMVLAAGRGERLFPLTRTVPKPAIPVLGRPLLGYSLRRLGAAGFARVAINTHHLPDRIRDIAGDGLALGSAAHRVFHENGPILGTGGGVRNALPFLRDGEAILVHNSDFVSDIDFQRAFAWHRDRGCPATMVLVPLRPGYTPVHYSPEEGKVIAIGGSPPSGLPSRAMTFSGCHLVEPDVIERLPEGSPSDIIRDSYVHLAAEGRLGGWVHDGFWWEFGTPRDYLDGSLTLIGRTPEERRSLGDGDPVQAIGEALAAVGTSVDLHAGGIELRGRLVLGLATRIGEGAHLQDSVIMPEAWVGPGARLQRTVVGMGTEIPAGIDLCGVLVCQDPGADIPLPPDVDRRNGLLVREL